MSVQQQLNKGGGIKNAHEEHDMPHAAVRVFEGELFNVYQWQQEMFDGSTRVFERLSQRDGVDVIAVTSSNTFLLLAEEQPARAPFLSIPGGRIDTAHEAIEAAARRELLEETGYAPASVELWFRVTPYAKNASADHIYIMRGCTKIQEADLDPGEKIEVRELSFDAFCEHVLRDDFRTKTVSLKIATMLARGEKEVLRTLLCGNSGSLRSTGAV